MRLFFAFFPPPPVQEALGDLQAKLQESAGAKGIRWTRKEQLHYTLRFLGELPADSVPRVVEAGKSMGAVASPFSVVFGKLEFLPNPQRPHTLVLGAQEGQAQMALLAHTLEKALLSLRLGIEPEKKPFRAHLTLARVKTAEGALNAQRLLQASWQEQIDALPHFMVESCTLVCSELRAEGPTYTPLAECTFQRSAETLLGEQYRGRRRDF